MRGKNDPKRPTAKDFKNAAKTEKKKTKKTTKKKSNRTTKKRGWLCMNNWSWHWYMGFNIGFEWYEGEIKSEGITYPVDYFLINIGPIRIQKAEWAWNKYYLS